MKKIQRLGLLLAGLLPLAALAAPSAGAKEYVPYLGYEYNSYEESLAAPVGYEPAGIYDGGDLGVEALSEPKDLVFAGGLLYLLDSGNSRIVVLDADMKRQRVIDGFNDKGEPVRFEKAEGLYVAPDGRLLVADTANLRILEADAEGNLLRVLEKPKTQLLAAEREFKVSKVIEDANGRIYALVKGINEGAVAFNKDGSFAGFYGSNEVKATAQVVLDFVWRKFMTEKQIRNSQSYMPTEFTNCDIDSRGFIYTVTQSEEGESSVRQLNFKGSNLQERTAYGDLEWDRKVRDSLSTTFVDVDVDADDAIFLLDSSRGRVFSYAESGQLISVFGGLGSQLGMFKSACAVETWEGRVYVLDDLRGAVTVFEPNAYAAAIRTALRLHESGDYAKATAYWEQVRAMNSNSEAAYYGIGMALDEAGKYKEALPYFKLAYEHKAYSDAFREVRKDFIKANFPWLLGGLVLLLAGLVLLARMLKKRFARENAYVRSSLESRYSAPLFTMLHPLDGFENLQLRRGWSVGLALGLLTALFLALTGSWFLTGFAFNDYRSSDFNVLITLMQAFGVVVVWIIANWAVCTLIEGKGRLKDIFCTTVYALLPFILSLLVAVLLSNVLTLEEAAFVTFVRQAGIWWSVVLLLCGLSRIHQFGFGKTLLSVLLTLVGMAIIVFLLIMFFGLMQQVINFVKSIYSEIQMMR